MSRPRTAGGARDDLVIVESPAKAKTIERYLGPGYRVLASYGHVRDLPAKALGVDLDHDFAPRYEPLKDRRRELERLASEARHADQVWLATDLDREGESIAWHIAEDAGLTDEQIRRVTFSVQSVTRSERRKSAPPPFTTSTLQQEASRKLGFGASRTMRAAQSLYEGIALAEGQVGLITYMRTDSVTIASGAVAEARQV